MDRGLERRRENLGARRFAVALAVHLGPCRRIGRQSADEIHDLAARFFPVDPAVLLENLRRRAQRRLVEQVALLRLARRVADHRRAVADEGDGLIARHLQPLHEAQGHKVPHMQRICRRVKANIERNFFLS